LWGFDISQRQSENLLDRLENHLIVEHRSHVARSSDQFLRVFYAKLSIRLLHKTEKLLRVSLREQHLTVDAHLFDSVEG